MSRGFFQRFRKDVLGISFLAAALFLGLALLSFNPADPSFNSTGHALKVSNYCGYVGSFLADALFQVFGLTTWLLVVGLLKISYSGFQGEQLNLKNTRVLWGVSLVVTLSTLVSVYWPTTKVYSEQIFLGGLLGLGVSQAMIRVFNPIGVMVIFWTLAIVLVVFYSEKTLKELAAIPMGMIAKAKQLSWFAKASKPGKKSKREDKAPANGAMSFALGEKDKEKKPTKQLLFPLIAKEIEEDEKDAKFLSGEEDDSVITEDDFDVEFDEPQEVEIAKPLKRKVVAPKAIPKKVANWDMPKLELLDDPPATRTKLDEKEIKRKAELLTEKFNQFDIEGQVVEVKPGPVVTMFEYKPNAHVKLSKITELADDLSMALSSESLRIIAPIPGRDVVGIETSNAQRETVFLKDLLAEEVFWTEDFKLPIALGRQANGEPRIVDLRKMPHLLVAGTTGSGKSVFTVSAITGLLFRHSPQTLRLILVDPKQVDLAAFQSVPHLLMPTVTEPKKAVSALRWAIREMEKRYRSMKKFGQRGLEGFNEAVSKLNADQVADHDTVNQELDLKAHGYYFTPQPYIVIVVEEFGDLMAVDKINVEQAVVRLAQMARACGIHLILAMQSPRKEVVTGLIKTNIPGRISFKVASKMDSRIILDEGGAERLLAHGDMLFLSPGVAKPMRHHGPFLKESEITGVAKFWSEQAEPEFDQLAMRALEGNSSQYNDGEAGEFSGESGDEEYDDRYDEILAWASDQKEVSASLIQRKFRLGYPRAARLIEVFEKEGVVGPANGSKPRQVLVNSYKEQ